VVCLCSRDQKWWIYYAMKNYLLKESWCILHLVLGFLFLDCTPACSQNDVPWSTTTTGATNFPSSILVLPCQLLWRYPLTFCNPQPSSQILVHMVLGTQTRTICDKCNHVNKVAVTYPRHHKLFKTGCKSSPQPEIKLL